MFCANCGRYFYMTEQFGWGYAVGNHYTCTYHCMRELEAKMLTQNEKDQIRKLMEEGKTAKTIARITGIKEHSVAVAVGIMKKKALEAAKAETETPAEPAAEEQPQPIAEAQEELRETFEDIGMPEEEEPREEPEPEKQPEEAGKAITAADRVMIIGLMRDMLDLIGKMYGI